MTAKSLILSTVGLLVLLGLVKVFFILLFNMEPWYMVSLFLVVIMLVTTGVVRRAGVLNNFEVLVAIIFWTPVILLWDFVVLGPILGLKIYYTLYFWLNYVGMLAAIVLFHKWAPLDKG